MFEAAVWFAQHALEPCQSLAQGAWESFQFDGEGSLLPSFRQAENSLLAAFEANQGRWRAIASLPGGDVALRGTCKAAAQKSSEELSVKYGCEF